MATATVLYGPSYSTLRRRAFSRAQADATTLPGSVLLFESNEAIRDASVADWASAPSRNALQLDTDGLASFVSRAHDRLIEPTPEVGTLERQRTIERALEGGASIEGGASAEEASTEGGAAIENGRHYANAFSELFRALEAHGALTPDDVRAELTAGDLDPSLVAVVTTVFERYCDLRDELAHPHARTQSETFLTVADASGSLAEAFPAVDHVIVSGYVDPSPVEVAVFERVAEEFPTTFMVPAIHRRESASGAIGGPEPVGTDAVLSATLAAYESLDLEFEYVPSDDEPPDGEPPMSDVGGRMFSIAATGEPVDAADLISWHEAPTPDREVRHLARRLRNQLATTEIEPEDVLVFAPGLLSYRERIDDIFVEYEIPYVAPVSILLERTYAGRAMLDAAALCTDPDAEHLARLATNPTVTLDGIDTAELVSLVQRLPSTDVDALRNDADVSLRAPIDEVLDSADTVRRGDGVETLDAFGRLLDSFAIRSNVEALEIEDGLADESEGDESIATARSISSGRAGEREVAIGYEERAIQQVRSILDSLVPVIEGGVDDPMAELEDALAGVRVSPPKQLPDGRVRVVGLEDVPMADYTHLYVLGATRENLPADPNRPRYFQRVADAVGVLPEERDREIARYRFGLALANAETVHVTTPAETMQGADVLPSPMLDELRTVAEIERSEGVEDERRGSREDVQRALAGTDPDRLDEPMDAAAADGVYSTAQIDSMRAGVLTCANRAVPGPTTHDGQLEARTLSTLGPDLRKSPYSPSRLNRYATCGFRYYLQRGLELSEPEEISPDVGRFAIGTVVHRALEFFYEDLLDDGDGPVNLAAYERDELERRLLAAGLQAIEAADETFESPFDRHQLRTVFAGLATPSENVFYGARDGADEAGDAQPEATGLLVNVLDRERSDDGGHPRFVEAWFGDDETPVTLPDGTSVPIHGMIDRVDLAERDDGGLAVRVIDYKTYDTDAKDAVRGLDFQLPAYLLGARSLVERALGVHPDEIDGEYRVFKPPSKVTHKQSLAQRVEKDLEADVDDFLANVVPEWIERAVDGIESGAFHPAVVGADTAGCHHCDYAAVCDVRHHRRFDTIDAIDRDGHPGYVPAGTRHGELEDHVSLGRSGGEDR